ncbi:MAG: fumarylacetoacetate hydrolase family protein, partial [Acetobacteraceae bacterium]
MKFATLKKGTRDGVLLVVSRDLRRAVRAQGAGTLIEALKSWNRTASGLEALYEELNAGRAGNSFDLDTAHVAAPLPRAPQWLDASAYHSHGDLMDQVFGAPPIEGKRETPLMYQGASDDFLGPRQDMPLPSEADGIDFEAELGVVTDFVPMATPASKALAHVKLIVLLNDASLRVLAGRELKTGFGFLQSKPATSFAPVAITPDELGDCWHDGRVHLPVRIQWNGRNLCQPDAV